MQQFRQMADIQTADMLQLPIPKLFQGKAIVVSAPGHACLKSVCRVAGQARRKVERRPG